MYVIFINTIVRSVSLVWFNFIEPLIKSPNDGFLIYCLEKHLLSMELP